MEPSAVQGRALRFDHEAFEEHQPWVVHDRGIERRGEAIVSERVDPEWGRPLKGDLSLRIVFFTVPRRIAAGLVQDRRIAMAVPSRSPLRTHPSLDREIRAIQEARARYVLAYDPDAVAVSRAMEDRESSMRGELARRFASSFSQGRIYTDAGIKVRPKDVFGEDDPASWADSLARGVLGAAYPELPYDHTAFPRTLTAGAIASIYRGVFQEDPDARAAAESFGPALGLMRGGTPPRFDASESRSVAIVRSEVESRGGEVSAGDVLRLLTGVRGLIRPLALLYLLAFVRHVQGELELAANHGVTSRRGAPFQGDRITWDLIPEVAFSEGLADHLGKLRLRPSATWGTTLPYASLLDDGLEPAKDERGVAVQERRLLATLRRVAAEVTASGQGLDVLENGLGRRAAGARGTLDALRSLCAASDFREVCSVAQARFQSPAGLDDALAAHRRLVQLNAVAPSISKTKRYLDRMSFGRDHDRLRWERDSLAARLDPDSLATNPRLWPGIEGGFARLRANYASAYIAHHAQYHQKAVETDRRLDDLRHQVDALKRFNTIPELGPPVGTEVPGLLADVASSFRTCAVDVDETSVEAAPCCQACQLRLDEDVPRREAPLLFAATEKALREHNRRLGTHAVRRLLAHPTKEQLDRFVGVVQVADTSALTNVLDDDVVEFLRAFLRSD